MGVPIDVYRARIGLHHSCLRSSRASRSSRTHEHQAFNPFGLSTLCVAAGVIVCLLLIAGVEPNPGPNAYVCKYCKLSFKSTLQYTKHLLIHSHWKNFAIECCFCSHKFKNAASLESHISRFHRDVREKPPSLPAVFSCPVDACKEDLGSREDYMNHMSDHLQESATFQCSLHNCKSMISQKRQFQKHMSRDHPVNAFGGTSHTAEINDQASTESSCHVNLTDGSEENVDMEAGDVGDEEIEQEDPYPEHIIKDDIARFYLKLEGECLMATMTVQEISEEIARLTEYSHHCLRKTLYQQLSNIGLPELAIKSIIHTTFDSDPVFNVHHKDKDIEYLGSDYFRNKYWHKRFPFVQPEEIYFGVNDAGKKRVAQYVSIKETLQVLLRDEEIRKMILKSFQREGNTPTVLEDFCDGSGYAAHKCQHADGKCLQLLLFQDAFDFAAFGPSAGVHKPIGFYWTLGNLPSEYRSQLDLILLAYMILEKDTRATMQEELDGRDILKETLAPLLDELKRLNTEGIEIDGEKIPVCLLYIIGDSLGQHTIGGYVKSFSAEFVCRFCDMSKTQFKNRPYDVNPFRSPEEYDEAVANAKKLYERRKKEALRAAKKTQLRKAGKKSASGTGSTSVIKTSLSKSAFQKLCGVNYKGVKYRPSPFNSTDLNFHVSSQALPPCISHDFLEGILKSVLAKMMQYFIETKKWFDLKVLNRRIKMFKCKGTDSLDPPKPLKKLTELTGNACQNWNFLRLLPFIIGDLIKDEDDPVWQMYLSLKEICEYVFAPKISMPQVAYLKSIIRSYLSTVKKVFPECLIPKGHFASHYCDLISIYGPLIGLSTLRFESKHMLFKRIARTCHNYINITHTLARKYMCRFAYDNSSGLLRPDIDYNPTQTKQLLYVQLPVEKLQALPDDFNFDGVDSLDSVKVKGTCYQKGLYLVLAGNEENSNLIFGEIDMILLDGKNNVSFVLKEKEGINSFNGYYKIIEASKLKYHHIFHKNLIDYYPLPAYKYSGHPECISLKHSVLCM